jgi:hypothetical protein
VQLQELPPNMHPLPPVFGGQMHAQPGFVVHAAGRVMQDRLVPEPGTPPEKL